MSKIGDVIVKLLLDSDQYEKGLSKSKNTMQDFAKSLSSGFTMAAGKVAMVIGAIKGIGKALESVSNANQNFGDKWQEFTSGLRGAWDEFARAVATMNFDNLVAKMKGASDAARELYNAVDAMGEINTSYNIASAQQAKHLAELRIGMNDQTKSYEERIAAAREWLKISENLNKFPLRGLARVQDATIEKTMKQMGINLKGQSKKAITALKVDFIEFFKWLGTEQGEAVYGKLNATNNRADRASGKDARNWQNIINRGEVPGGEGWVSYLRQYANKVNDEDRQALEDAIVNFLKADASFAETSRRVQNTLNTLLYQQSNQQSKNSGVTDTTIQDAKAKANELRQLSNYIDAIPFNNNLVASVESISANMPDIISDEWLDRQHVQAEKLSAMLEEMSYKSEEIAWSFANAVQSGIVGSIDVLADAVANGEQVDGGAVVKALLSPLADACISAGMLILTTGTAVEALRETLLAGLATGGAAAIAAGVGLVAVGAAAKLGLAAIGSGRGSTHSAATTTTSSIANSDTQTINSELTIYVKGTLSGSDILLAGERTINSRRR